MWNTLFHQSYSFHYVGQISLRLKCGTKTDVVHTIFIIALYYIFHF